MRIKLNPYILLIIYELVRLFTLLRQGAETFTGDLPITWYASVGLLILTPLLFSQIMFDEHSNSSSLPLVAIIKLIQIPSLIVFCFRSWPNALRFALAGDFILLKPILSSIFFIFVDAFILWYCVRRNKKICK